MHCPEIYVPTHSSSASLRYNDLAHTLHTFFRKKPLLLYLHRSQQCSGFYSEGSLHMDFPDTFPITELLFFQRLQNLVYSGTLYTNDTTLPVRNCFSGIASREFHNP